MTPADEKRLTSLINITMRRHGLDPNKHSPMRKHYEDIAKEVVATTPHNTFSEVENWHLFDHLADAK